MPILMYCLGLLVNDSYVIGADYGEATRFACPRLALGEGSNPVLDRGFKGFFCLTLVVVPKGQ